MRIFYFLARNISYTFAISFYSASLFWISAVIGYFISISFVIFPGELVTGFIIKWLPVSILVSSFFYFIQFGLMTPVKVEAFLRNFRSINSAFRQSLNIKDTEMERLYRSLSDLPMNNFMFTAFYAIFACILFLCIAFFNYWSFGNIEINDLKVIYKIVILAMMICMILFSLSSYLLTVSLTNNERVLAYNNLLRNGINVHPVALIGIRLRFFIFFLLMILTLITFVAIMEKNRYFEEFNVEVTLGYFVVSLSIFYLFMKVNTDSILRVLGDLRRVTKAIASGGKTSFNFLPLEKEFAGIENALMEMAWEIDEHRKNLEQKVEQRTVELQSALADLKLRDDMIQKQLDMASVIQRSILPGKIDDWNELKFSVRYIAMDKIGGDFYDIHHLKDDKLGVMIADVSGHGIPAALVTTMAKISFGNAGMKYDSPKRIFQEVNQNILDHVKTHDYMTCFMVSIDDEYNIVYSNASHQKAILLRTDEQKIELLDTNGLFIGAISDAWDSYEEKTVKLNYGDRLILYTDGIPESFNESRKEYSLQKFQKVILENSNLPMDEFADFLLDDVQQYIGNAKVEDDITLLIIELTRDEAIDIVKQSRKFINSHNFYEAIEVLENGLKKYPDNQKILYNLGKNYFRVNDYSKAAEHFEKYIIDDKHNKNAFYVCGATYYQLEDYKKAIDNFENSLELDSIFVPSLFALGMALKKKGDRERAIRTFEKVISIDSNNKMALFELKLLEEEE